MEQYLCHAIGCNERVLATRLMCGTHWFMVPPSLRRAVWKAYTPGQGAGSPTPTREYHDAAREAINAVATREGKPLLPDNINIIKTVERMIAQQKLTQQRSKDA